uniref:Uncharacterized protein n=1 Tax=Ixodes ricinus TaxID=34613 RepID=V5IFS9_IXORI
MLPPCHSYALTRRRFLPSKNRFAFICNTDFTLQCKTFMVVRVLNDENDLLSSAILPDQRAPYSSLESRILKYTFPENLRCLSFRESLVSETPVGFVFSSDSNGP